MSDTFDLDDFPPGYAGRRTYVHVRALGKMVPVIYTFRGTDGRNHLLPEYGGTEDGHARHGLTVIRDMSDYVSPLDGTHIRSRSQHREHMRRHEVIEVGNERMPARTEQSQRGVIGRDIKRAIEQLNGR